MRQNVQNRLGIQNKIAFAVALIFGGDANFFILFADAFDQFDVRSVAGARRLNVRFQRHAEQSQISQQVQRLMPHRLVFEAQLFAVQNAVGAELDVILETEQFLQAA